MDVVTRAEAEAYMNTFGDMPSSGVNPDIITDVSARMAEYTGREDWGEKTSRTEYYDGGSQYLLVDYWPVATVTSIADDTDHVWSDSDVIDSDEYWIGQKELGVIYFEGWQTQAGNENIKIVYTGGYDDTANVPQQVKRAGLIQIRYDVLRNDPSKFMDVPGRYEGADFSDFEGMGLLGETKILLQPYKRRVPFA